MAWVVRQALKDTGFLARQFLGYTYDKNEETGDEIPGGGIRKDGPHKLMTDFLDDHSREKMMQAPRGSYKTTILHAYAARRILADRNIRILWSSNVAGLARKSVEAIKEALQSEKIESVFGKVVTDRGSTAWTCTNRTRSGLKMPTIEAGSIGSQRTGCHYDLIILDDLVDNDNCKTKEGLEKVVDYYKMVRPFGDPGFTIIVNGTRYHHDDLYGYIDSLPHSNFKRLVLDAGVALEQDDRGRWDLIGEPSFEHLTIDFLKSNLSSMQHGRFSAQYLNCIVSDADQLFRRNQFQTAIWEERFSTYAAYILVDCAVSAQDDGCYSALVLVLLDHIGNIYIADVRVGHMQPVDFVEHYFDIYDKWSGKVTIRKGIFDKVALDQTFRANILEEGRRRQMRNVFTDSLNKGVNEPSKNQKIAALQGKFSNHQMFVLTDSVDRYFFDLGDQKVLFDPEGHRTADDLFLPSGELVDEFIKFPSYGKKDIADALATVVATTKGGAPMCPMPSHATVTQARLKSFRVGATAPAEITRNGIRQVVEMAYAQPGSRSRNWWVNRANDRKRRRG